MEEKQLCSKCGKLAQVESVCLECLSNLEIAESLDARLESLCWALIGWSEATDSWKDNSDDEVRLVAILDEIRGQLSPETFDATIFEDTEDESRG